MQTRGISYGGCSKAATVTLPTRDRLLTKSVVIRKEGETGGRSKGRNKTVGIQYMCAMTQEDETEREETQPMGYDRSVYRTTGERGGG